MNSPILKPIRRRTYVVGLLVFALISMIFGLGMFVTRGPQIAGGTLSFFLILAVLRLIWDYKRIKDISLNPTYLLLLLIPIVGNLVNLIRWRPEGEFYPGTGIEMIIFVIVFGIISLIYTLFLIFKKGAMRRIPPKGKEIENFQKPA
ncbi:MAG: hypothetical protein V4665_04060 [Patescibacteria group bacterium]